MTSQKLQLGIKQQMNLTLSMKQSINILQMSNIELSEMLSLEIQNNPFLQSDDNLESIENATVYNSRQYNKDEDFDLISHIAYQESPTENILIQINNITHNVEEKIIANYLLNLLQDSGYINLDLEGATQHLGISESKILDVLYKLQTLEPTGIFARNLSECLTLQLKEKGKYNDVFSIILSNLIILSEGKLEALSKKCDISINELKKYIAEIRLLNPKPASNIYEGYLPNRIADIIVEINEMGEIEVKTNPLSLPYVSLNRDFYNQVKCKTSNQNEKHFISTNYYEASNILRSVMQRQKTLKLVGEAIAESQKDFFCKGLMYLKPMNLNHIAALCGLNESTISRATSNKYIQTPYGIYDIKFFFTSGVKDKNNNQQVSSRNVKEIIKNIIDTENIDTIYSDDDLVLELKKFNIQVARRTVAKYRDLINIPPSNIRKKQIILKMI